MTTNSKMAFADETTAKAAQAKHGGSTGGFDAALSQSYLDMAKDTVMIRQRRAERRKKMMHKS
jgi:hypothetical protein